MLMGEEVKMAKEVAIKKRALIDKASQTMLVVVGMSAAVLGACVVGAVFFIKWIFFNGEVIVAKDEVLASYEKSLENLKSLRGSVLTLADNEDLESVARSQEDQCRGLDGKLIDFVGMIEETNNEDYRASLMERARECWALRVIPDALPAVNNPEALLASLNKIFLIVGPEPESIAPGSGSGGGTAVSGVGVIPVNLSIEGNATEAKEILSAVERSIRAFDVQTATIAWRGVGESEMISMKGSANAYYSSEFVVEKRTKTIRAGGGSGSSSSRTGGSK
jgi:hypothetical protein